MIVIRQIPEKGCQKSQILVLTVLYVPNSLDSGLLSHQQREGRDRQSWELLSRPDSGLGFQVKVLETFEVSLGSGA